MCGENGRSGEDVRRGLNIRKTKSSSRVIAFRNVRDYSLSLPVYLSYFFFIRIRVSSRGPAHRIPSDATGTRGEAIIYRLDSDIAYVRTASHAARESPILSLFLRLHASARRCPRAIQFGVAPGHARSDYTRRDRSGEESQTARLAETAGGIPRARG